MLLRSFTHKFKQLSRLSKVQKNAEEELDAYLWRGHLIREMNPDLYRSLDNLIEKNEDSDIVQEAKKNYKKHGRSLGLSFITVSAPRMAGKTQMAFTIDSKLPLYFVGNSKGELIYQNFTKLSHRLIQFARKDYVDINKKYPLINSGYVATVDILDDVDQMKLRSLGLLKAIIAEAKNLFKGFENISLTNWMKYLSSINPITCSDFPRVSIREFLNDPDYFEVINKFYMFIDEFSGEQELVLLKNICRLNGLTCVVASTNANIQNVVGTSPYTSSRVENPSIWTVVVPSLPLVPTAAIYNILKVSQALDRLIAISKFQEYFRMRRMSFFVLDQCEKSRPGISNIISDFVTNYIPTNKFNTIDFFTELVLKVSSEIKRRIFTNTEARMYNISLILGHQFDPTYKHDHDSSIDFVHEVDNHFYYLKNPYTSGTDPFALFQHNSCTPDESPELFTCTNEILMPKTYAPQYYFNEDEQVLLLACLIGEMKGSITSLVSKSKQAPNTTSLSEFENVICASLIDSSHFTKENPLGTFEGVPLEDFIINLIGNLDPASKDTKKQFVLKFRNSDLWLKNIKVPFLYCANLPVHSFYEYLFPPSESEIIFGKFTRPEDSKEFESSFDLFDGNNITHLAIVECKNWNDNLTKSCLHKSLLKSIQAKRKNDKCLVHFNFWRQIKDFESMKLDDICELTNENKINVYLLQVKDELNIELTPLSNKLSVHKDPSMIFIFIQTDN
jgi:hypothetical protein